MPLFEYRCLDCGRVLEKLRKYGDRDKPLTCPDCIKHMPRLFSAAHVEPDGTYSHDPNLGSEEKFVRWNEKIAKRKEAEREARG